MPNPIKKFNVKSLDELNGSKEVVYQQDFESIFFQVEAVINALFDRNSFIILSGFGANNDGTFKGGSFFADGKIYTIPESTSILSGSYLRPTEDLVDQRSSSNNSPYYQYTEYTAIVDNSYTNLPPITQENINKYRFVAFVSDLIANNLTTNDPNKVLSAAMGVVLNSLALDKNLLPFKFIDTEITGTGTLFAGTFNRTSDYYSYHHSIYRVIDGNYLNRSLTVHSIGDYIFQAGSPYDTSGKTIANLVFNVYGGNQYNTSTPLAGKNFAFVVAANTGPEDGSYVYSYDGMLNLLQSGDYSKIRFSIDSVGNIVSYGLINLLGGSISTNGGNISAGAGNVSGNNANFTGSISGASAAISGNVLGGSAVFAGDIESINGRIIGKHINTRAPSGGGYNIIGDSLIGNSPNTVIGKVSSVPSSNSSVVLISNNGSASGIHATGVGYGVNASGNFSSAYGDSSVASGSYSSAYGYSSVASGNFSSAYGDSSVASGESSVGIGLSSQAFGNYSVCIGQNSQASGNHSVGIGLNSQAFGDFSVSIGRNSHTADQYSIAIGYFSTADYLSSIAIGVNSMTRTNGDIAIGVGADTLPRPSTPDTGPIMQLGNNSSLRTLRSAVPLTVTSDEREKINIKRADFELNKSIFMDLEVVEYNNNQRTKYYNYKECPINSKLHKEVSDSKETCLKNIENLKDDDYVLKNNISEDYKKICIKENEEKIKEFDRELKRIEYVYDDFGGVKISDEEGYKTGKKAGKRKHVGLIAQQVQKVLIEKTGGDSYLGAVHDPNYGSNGEYKEQAMGLTYEKFLPMTMQMVQELIKSDEEKTKRIQELEDEIKGIKEFLKEFKKQK